MNNVPKYTVIIHDLSTDAAVETIPAIDFSPRLKPGDSSFTDWCWLSPARGWVSLI